jgi:hypothetical protein
VAAGANKDPFEKKTTENALRPHLDASIFDPGGRGNAHFRAGKRIVNADPTPSLLFTSMVP